MKMNLCIHGHFYQPPRENAWTGVIEEQPSAQPFHDWNEKIWFECYRPNSEAEVTDNNGIVTDIINLYEYLSFNFGATLIDWIKRNHPETYLKIINADRLSVQRFNGHGNAISQVYNHIIMPLANKRDKITQVKWGLEDFRFHFNRNAEGMWLSETACNPETLEVLANEGVKFVILDPSQAGSIRKMNSDEWQFSYKDKLDLNNPYRYFIDKDKLKYIDIFFYNFYLSKSISFDDTLSYSSKLLERINSVSSNANENDLLFIATDGETFGHHKKFADKTLAYFFKNLIPGKYNITNPGSFLAMHQPEYEVLLKQPDDSSGTAWSCFHGVKRWEDDCGCTISSEEGWNQQWRKPLRETLNWLNEELWKIFKTEGSIYFSNVEKARNEYIKVLADPTEEKKAMFLFENAVKYLDINEANRSFQLLEMQKFSMLMFTSCGWFFSEISGIETVQIIQYAVRAIELAEELTGISLEYEFAEKLEQAKSNLPEFRTGKGVYEKLIKSKKAV